MASSELNETLNLIAGEDLRGDLYEVLTLENDGGVAKVIKATTVNQVVVGVLAENPRSDLTTDGLGVPVTLLKGRVKFKAGATITAGELLVVDATAGRVAGIANLAAAAADSFIIGMALESAVDGDVFEALAFSLSGATD